MNRQWQAWQVSIGLHALLFGGFSLLATGMAMHRRPVQIDLSFSGTAPPAVAPQGAPPAPRPVATIRPAAPVKSETPPAPPPAMNESSTPDEQAPIPPPAVVAAPAVPVDGVAGGSDATPAGDGAGSAVGNGGVAAVPGPGSADMATPQQLYLREHFAYIRNLIMQELGYPPLARRMGWSGQVVVSFVVRENGGVEDLKIVRGSGKPVLDENALATVARVAPFPRPPTAAEIVMPIAYRLN